MASEAAILTRPVWVGSSGGPPVGLPAGEAPLGANDGREAELKGCWRRETGDRATGAVAERSEERKRAADMGK
jgi:hypothetical protein